MGFLPCNKEIVRALDATTQPESDTHQHKCVDENYDQIKDSH